MSPDEKYVLLYTDGSCERKSRRGGWAWSRREMTGICATSKKTHAQGDANTTISRMEMSAIIDGLACAFLDVDPTVYPKILVVSDSQFIVNSFQKGWYETWKSDDFFGRPNDDLWKLMRDTLELVESVFDVRFVHTKSHGRGMEFHKEGNDEVDELCSYKNFIEIDEFDVMKLKRKYEGDDRHCSFCQHYWTDGEYMYCCLLKHKITAKRKNGCEKFESMKRKTNER